MTTPDMDHATKKIIMEFAKTIEMFNLNPLEARLFAYLYLTKKTMTLDEMGESLGKSKTSMSTSIRGLAELNLVSRVWIKGVRKDLYQSNDELFKLFMSTYTNKWIDAIEHQQAALLRIQADMCETTLEDKKTCSQLKKLIDFHAKVANFFKEMKTD